MSLSTRVTAIEEYEPWSREHSPEPRQRKLSFNPLGPAPGGWEPPVAYEEPVGAFEVPKWKRMRKYTRSQLFETDGC